MDDNKSNIVILASKSPLFVQLQIIVISFSSKAFSFNKRVNILLEHLIN